MQTSAWHSLGYLRHWLITGPQEALYEGPSGEENILRLSALDHRQVEPPASAALNEPGPFGAPWRFHYPGENFFVEHTKFHHRLTVVDSYAYTEIESAQETVREAHLWAAGFADLWINEVHITRLEVTRYMYPDVQRVMLPLRRGANRICVRLQVFGVRDTRNLFGLQLMDTTGLAVCVPGCALLVEAAHWLDGVRVEGRDAVVCARSAPANATISLSGGCPISWPEGASRFSLADPHPFEFAVEVTADNQTLRRSFEIPANRSAAAVKLPADVRTTRLELIARVAHGEDPQGLPLRGGDRRLLARRLLGVETVCDARDFASSVASVDRREDCADFALAGLLRLEALGLATPGESAEIRRAALAFCYWSDEPGMGGMCYWSENHSLLFHICQLMAGRLYPADIFSNSQRTGAEQAALGAARCREWLDKIEPRGFEEFNSGTYLPITMGALLNVVDFCGDAEVSCRAAALLDGLYRDLAAHAFDGVVVSPQGRVYRNVLYPGESGTQALLSDATPAAPPDFLSSLGKAQAAAYTGDWIVYQASSPHYRPPMQLDALIAEPVSKRYTEGGAEIVLHKTPAYLLTSLAVPAESLSKEAALHFQPGAAGYQQHLWQATLGRECHIFVNHPGGSFDHSLSRPGYWYGNGVMPRLRQREGVLEAIFNIPDGSTPAQDRTPDEYAWPPFSGNVHPYDLHPIPFTHAHWPSDVFDRQETREHWLFGQKNSGYIALWCSEPLKPHDDVLTGREFQAWAYRSAWGVMCGSLAEQGTFENFIAACLARQPEFDRTALALKMQGEEPLLWK